MSNNGTELFSLEAEQAMIGAVLMNNDAFQLATKYINSSHLYEGIHQSIWGVIEQLIEAGKHADPIILRAFLPKANVIPNVTTGQYLARLAASATTIINVPDYARAIRELADRRRLAEIGNSLQPIDASHPVGLATEAISALDAVIAANTADTGAPALELRKGRARAVDAAAAAYQMDGHVIGVPTTLRDLDHKLGGMSPGDFVVLAGRPGM